MIPEWCRLEELFLLPKTKNLNDEKNYRPITCLNTYKILDGPGGEIYERAHNSERIWDEDNSELQKAYWAQSISLSLTDASYRRSSSIIAT